MVQNSGKTLCINSSKPVNLPEPVRVEEDSSGLPLAIRLNRKQAILAIENQWRIDDEWWRDIPVSRHYYIILLTSGQRLTLYKDLTGQGWYRQTY